MSSAAQDLGVIKLFVPKNLSFFPGISPEEVEKETNDSVKKLKNKKTKTKNRKTRLGTLT